MFSSKKYFVDVVNPPQVLVLTETWTESTPYMIPGYWLAGFVGATRTKKAGRASGGAAVYVHKSCSTPINATPLSSSAENTLTIRVKTSNTQKDLAIVAYHLPTSKREQEVTTFFKDIAEEVSSLQDAGFATILVGDSNGDRDEKGKVICNNGRSNIEAIRLVETEQRTGHIWRLPNSKFGFTRYETTKKNMESSDGYDPRSGTSRVDHMSHDQHISNQRNINEYSLDEDEHMR